MRSKRLSYLMLGNSLPTSSLTTYHIHPATLQGADSVRRARHVWRANAKHVATPAHFFAPSLCGLLPAVGMLDPGRMRRCTSSDQGHLRHDNRLLSAP